MNPMSVHIKARITLPAIIHTFIGAKHPLLATGVHSVSSFLWQSLLHPSGMQPWAMKILVRQADSINVH